MFIINKLTLYKQRHETRRDQTLQQKITKWRFGSCWPCLSFPFLIFHHDSRSTLCSYTKSCKCVSASPIFAVWGRSFFVELSFLAWRVTIKTPSDQRCVLFLTIVSDRGYVKNYSWSVIVRNCWVFYKAFRNVLLLDIVKLSNTNKIVLKIFFFA